jgi:hypothetical protein
MGRRSSRSHPWEAVESSAIDDLEGGPNRLCVRAAADPRHASHSGFLPEAIASRAAGAIRAFETTIKPVLQTYCYTCHGGSQPATGFDLASYATQDSVLKDQRRWNLVLARLRPMKCRPASPDNARRWRNGSR